MKAAAHSLRPLPENHGTWFMVEISFNGRAVQAPMRREISKLVAGREVVQALGPAFAALPVGERYDLLSAIEDSARELLRHRAELNSIGRGLGKTFHKFAA